MPNWVEQDLHVVGPKTEIDRFIRLGFVRRRPGELDNVLDFRRLCPLKRNEPKTTFSHPSGVVLARFRTRTQACFSFITSWNYPAEFYARLPVHWPKVAFVCSVNEDMGQFGGIVMVLDAVVSNLVRDYDAGYSRRTHARHIRSALKRWHQFLTEGRPWRLSPTAPWENKSMPFDAHFTDDFWFYFRTREELARFKGRYKSDSVMRQVGNEWRRARV